MLELKIEPIQGKTSDDLVFALEQIKQLIEQGFTCNLDKPRFNITGEEEEELNDDELYMEFALERMEEIKNQNPDI